MSEGSFDVFKLMLMWENYDFPIWRLVTSIFVVKTYFFLFNSCCWNHLQMLLFKLMIHLMFSVIRRVCIGAIWKRTYIWNKWRCPTQVMICNYISDQIVYVLCWTSLWLFWMVQTPFFLLAKHQNCTWDISIFCSKHFTVNIYHGTYLFIINWTKQTNLQKELI